MISKACGNPVIANVLYKIVLHKKCFFNRDIIKNINSFSVSQEVYYQYIQQVCSV